MSIDKEKPWFIGYAKNVTSQFGEDGIIEKILQIIGETNNWCVEFGASDGKYCSNTFNLIENKKYSAVLIEADPNLFVRLQQTYANKPGLSLINTFVGLDKNTNLDSILRKTSIPKNPDLVIIDIDGNDYYIWESFEEFRPKICVVEYNPTIPSEVEFVQPADVNISQGASLKSLVKLGKKKGYELVAATFCNGIFVDEKYYSQFGLKDNSIHALRYDEKAVTYIFSGYDGHIFLTGGKRLPWHQLALKENRMQALPAFLQRYPDRYNPLQRVLAYLHRSLRKKRII